MGRWVIALGGNAILQPGQRGTTSEQWDNVRSAARQLTTFVQDGHQLIITHGNGPQVGILLEQQEAVRDRIPPWSLDLCGAQTQGLLGFMLQHALAETLASQNINRDICTLITEVVVDPDDQAFRNPSKPVGTFLSEDEAKHRMLLGEVWEEDAGRGWRRMVASPQPLHIRNIGPIRRLLDSDYLIIAAGGGGIPVAQHSFAPLEAVIDKDLTASLLARILDADGLMILTDIHQVYLHYGQVQQTPLYSMTATEAERYYADGHFRKGSMGPKILAGIQVAKRGKVAIIAQLGAAAAAMRGESGTRILPD